MKLQEPLRQKKGCREAVGGQFDFIASAGRSTPKDLFSVETYFVAERHMPKLVCSGKSLNAKRALRRNDDAGVGPRQAGAKETVEGAKQEGYLERKKRPKDIDGAASGFDGLPDPQLVVDPRRCLSAFENGIAARH